MSVLSRDKDKERRRTALASRTRSSELPGAVVWTIGEAEIRAVRPAVGGGVAETSAGERLVGVVPAIVSSSEKEYQHGRGYLRTCNTLWNSTKLANR
jgi:hypothetical protein